MPKYQRGVEFPHEGFVQRAIETYFTSKKYTILEGDYSDLVCINEQDNEKWAIEAKGKTSAIGLDFRTGLGQLIQRMTQQETNYALAIPEIKQFIKQASIIPKWVRESLNIHLILVDEKENIKIITPNEDIEYAI